MIPRGPLGDAFSDPNLLGTAIAGDTWNSWRTLLIAAMSEDLSEDERETFTHLTGREDWKTVRHYARGTCRPINDVQKVAPVFYVRGKLVAVVGS